MECIYPPNTCIFPSSQIWNWRRMDSLMAVNIFHLERKVTFLSCIIFCWFCYWNWFELFICLQFPAKPDYECRTGHSQHIRLNIHFNMDFLTEFSFRVELDLNQYESIMDVNSVNYITYLQIFTCEQGHIIFFGFSALYYIQMWGEKYYS